jgi:ribonuclease HI
MASRLEYFCTNNQDEYEALLFILEILESMDVKYVKSFGDSLLVVHQVSGKYKCLDGSLNAYLDKCLDIIVRFDEFLYNTFIGMRIVKLMIWHNKHLVIM